MLHEEPVPLDDDVHGTSMASKRRRKSSSSEAPTATVQGHQTPIDWGRGEDERHGASFPRCMATGEHEEEIKELFGPQVILSEEDQAGLVKLLPPDNPPRRSLTEMSWEDNYEQLERHGRLRIAYFKAIHGVNDLVDAYSEDEIRQNGYFQHFEEEEFFEWFFHTDDSWNPDLDDYQRIVLRSFMPGCIEPLYPDVDRYHERYHTYEMDAVYLKYYGELSKKIKWIQEYSHLDEKSAEWTEITIKGWRQALRIATQLPDMTLNLADLAYDEYIYELREDASLKDLDLVFFLIWRLVVKDNKSYMDALKEVYNMDKFHIHKRAMEAEVNKAPTFLTMGQKISFVTEKERISVNTEDVEARVLFRKGLAHFKTKYMVNYAEKKLEIAKRFNWHKSIDIPGRIEAPEQFEMQ